MSMLNYSQLSLTVHNGPLPDDHPFKNKNLYCEFCGEPIYNPTEGSLRSWAEFNGRVQDIECLAKKQAEVGKTGVFA